MEKKSKWKKLFTLRKSKTSTQKDIQTTSDRQQTFRKSAVDGGIRAERTGTVTPISKALTGDVCIGSSSPPVGTQSNLQHEQNNFKETLARTSTNEEFMTEEVESINLIDEEGEKTTKSNETDEGQSKVLRRKSESPDMSSEEHGLTGLCTITMSSTVSHREETARRRSNHHISSNQTFDTESVDESEGGKTKEDPSVVMNPTGFDTSPGSEPMALKTVPTQPEVPVDSNQIPDDDKDSGVGSQKDIVEFPEAFDVRQSDCRSEQETGIIYSPISETEQLCDAPNRPLFIPGGIQMSISLPTNNYDGSAVQNFGLVISNMDDQRGNAPLYIDEEVTDDHRHNQLQEGDEGNSPPFVLDDEDQEPKHRTDLIDRTLMKRD